MNIVDDLIEKLSLLCGIVPEYYDIRGNLYTIPLDTKKAILSSLGIDTDSQDALREEIKERSLRPWLNIIEPVYVLSINEKPLRIPLYLPLEKGYEDKASVDFFVTDEAGDKRGFRIHFNNIVDESIVDGRRYVKVEFMDSYNYAPGYYELGLILNHYDDAIDGLKKKSRLILTPDAAYLPDSLKRSLGLSINLYSLRSRKNWGVGDFGDLQGLINWFAFSGGHLVGINPLHALSNTTPYGISPYSPLSRLYKNFIYLDMDQIGCGCMPEADYRDRIDRLRKQPLIDYEAVASIKLEVLEKAFKSFMKDHYGRDTQLDRDFTRFINDEGMRLDLFATYMAISERYKSFDWQSWPKEYQTPDSKAVKLFVSRKKEKILFYQYIQWLIDLQHNQVYEVAKRAGMPVGLYHDLAIGAIRGSSDVWCNKSLYALDVDVGAPPDEFSPDGQNWGFPPLIPEKMREDGYEFYIQTLRKNMRYAGALRIDHALGIFRLFWIPLGKSPKDGAYVRYPYEDLLRIIALESVRNRTVVVAEDLGTIGENVRENLSRFKMLSYRLFYFERNYPDPSFLAPSNYPELALTSMTTHDLPTIYGYWLGRDIEERRRLDKYPDDETWLRQLDERKRDRMLIIDALKREGLLSRDFQIPAQMTEELCLAIYRYLMKTPSRIVLISFDDMIGRINQQNMPGVIEGYPNWRQKTDMDLEDIIRRDSRFVKFIHGLFNPFIDDKQNSISGPANSIPD
ncbi:MAG: 4-alpha-glucanotransferase [Thermodesulfovibrionales bacterium]